MDVAKQIIDQRVNKIMEDNPELFFNDDIERRRSKTFVCNETKNPPENSCLPLRFIVYYAYNKGEWLEE